VEMAMPFPKESNFVIYFSTKIAEYLQLQGGGALPDTLTRDCALNPTGQSLLHKGGWRQIASNLGLGKTSALTLFVGWEEGHLACKN